MVLYSSEIAAQIAAQQAGQQMSRGPGVIHAAEAAQRGFGGVYGESTAMHLAGAGKTAMGVAGMGLGVAGMFTGMPLDPFSAVWSAGKMGMRMGGFAGGLAAATGVGMVAYGAQQAIGAYGGAFYTGMQQQQATNAVLRQNFNFSGGQGAFGRGFGQQQMGQIGSMLSAETRASPSTSSAELNQLISGGVDAGMFTAVRDVQQFSQRFRTMIDSLRKIQKELGGTLSEAMQFTRGSQQLGIFSAGSTAAFAGEMRSTMASTGMSQDQLFSVAAQGSMLSRASGGLGRQGATGALRMARSLGAAVNSGVLNQEALSEATGGLTGTDAIQAFTARMMQQTERFSRRGMGRYSIFALSNAEGTGLEQEDVSRFLAGDIDTGSVRRDALGRVRGMGRAKAINREGMLRGALLEQGGLAGQIGMMKLMVGDRVLDQGDDLASQVLQRRFGMGRSEAEMSINLMRNQSTIAQQEAAEGRSSKREMAMRNDINENRSIDAFMEHLQTGLQDATGISKVRELGRNFVTKISSLTERVMNDFLGVSASAMSRSDSLSMSRLSMGMATSADLDRLKMVGGGAAVAPLDLYGKSSAHQALHALGIHTPRSVGETMDARGQSLVGMSAQQRDATLRSVQLAQRGLVSGADSFSLAQLMRNKDATMARLGSADLMASLTGDPGNVYGSFKDVGANAIDAFRARSKLGTGLSPNEASLLGANNGGIDWGNIGAEAGIGAARGAMMGGGIIGGSTVGAIIGGVGYGAMALLRGKGMSEQDKAISFLSKGGHFGNRARMLGGVLSEKGSGNRFAREYSESSGIGFDEARAMFKSGGEVDENAMRTVMQSEDTQEALRRIASLKGNPKAQEAEIQRMQQKAATMGSEEERKAALMTVRMLRDNVKRFGGGIGNEFLSAINETAREREIKREMEKVGGDYAGLAEAVGADTVIGKELTGISNQFYGYDDGKNIDQKITAMQSRLANLDPNSEEYRKVAKSMGSSDVGRGLMLGVSAQRAFMRDATNGGRRGSRQGAETVFGALTGGSLSEMEFSIGGKKIGPRNIAGKLFSEFRNNGKGADELMTQMVDQLDALGVGGASEKVQELRKMISSDGISKDEASVMYQKFMKDPDLQRVRNEGVKRQQESRDPLGVERNTLLQRILDKLPDNPEAANQSVPKASQ